MKKESDIDFNLVIDQMQEAAESWGSVKTEMIFYDDNYKITIKLEELTSGEEPE